MIGQPVLKRVIWVNQLDQGLVKLDVTKFLMMIWFKHRAAKLKTARYGRGITGQAVVSHLVLFQVQFVNDQELKDAIREIVQKYQTILRMKREDVAILIANLLVNVCKIIILVMHRITHEL